ncbi:GNAT family N-acetyltransferase [Microaerobacter geothermalis]|uniref:GNAT family N-acetyltransferase n=1 Tax=Microaerobacter geothermalis TaxID=674972 RepID=UPI001F4717C6|nr:GNAT family protein [Microaerobacter geothermalis]MCF6094774.1 GNAT family N-acetyltransferase [Microaerobacter geothermalis]
MEIVIVVIRIHVGSNLGRLGRSSNTVSIAGNTSLLSKILEKRVKAILKHIINDDLELRLLEPFYTEVIFQEIHKNREYLSKWFPWVEKTTSSDDTRARITSELQRFANNNGFSLGIFYRNKYIGTISFHDVNWNVKMTSIGYWLSSEYQGLGIMTTCCKELLRHGFEVMGLNRIEIRARTDNTRSIAIPVRLGFKEEGILRQVDFHHNQYYDHVVYGLLKNEWTSSQGKGEH